MDKSSQTLHPVFRKKLPPQFFKQSSGTPHSGRLSVDTVHPNPAHPVPRLASRYSYLPVQTSRPGTRTDAGDLTRLGLHPFRRANSLSKSLDTRLISDQSNNIRLLLETHRQRRLCHLLGWLVLVSVCSGVLLTCLDWPVYHHDLSLLNSSQSMSEVLRDLLLRGRVSVHVHNHLAQSPDLATLRRRLLSWVSPSWSFVGSLTASLAWFWLLSFCLYQLVGFSRLFKAKSGGLRWLSRSDWLWLGLLSGSLLLLVRSIFHWMTPSAIQAHFLRILAFNISVLTLGCKFLLTDFGRLRKSTEQESILSSRSPSSDYQPYLPDPPAQGYQKTFPLAYFAWAFKTNLTVCLLGWICSLVWMSLHLPSPATSLAPEISEVAFLKSVFGLIWVSLLACDVSLCAVRVSLDRDYLAHLVDLSDFSLFLKLLLALSRKSLPNLGNQPKHRTHSSQEAPAQSPGTILVMDLLELLRRSQSASVLLAKEPELDTLGGPGALGSIRHSGSSQPPNRNPSRRAPVVCFRSSRVYFTIFCIGTTSAD